MSFDEIRIFGEIWPNFLVVCSQEKFGHRPNLICRKSSNDNILLKNLEHSRFRCFLIEQQAENAEKSICFFPTFFLFLSAIQVLW